MNILFLEWSVAMDSLGEKTLNQKLTSYIKANNLVKRYILFFVGLFIIQIGVALFIELDIGSDPFTLLTQGLANILHISVGGANRIATFILFVLVACVDRKNINIGTLLCVLCTGVLIDFMIAVYAPISFDSFSLPLKVILFIVACIPIAIGFPILKLAELGIAPNDLTYFAIVDLSHKPYGIVRTLTDATYLILGILLGSKVGIGTVLCLLLIGPLIQNTFPIVTKCLTKLKMI